VGWSTGASVGATSVLAGAWVGTGALVGVAVLPVQAANSSPSITINDNNLGCFLMAFLLLFDLGCRMRP
jgi:hypothetical protein